MINDRLTNLETVREQPTVEQPPLQPHARRNNAPVPDEQYLKSIRLDVHTFDGRLDFQFFLDWLQDMHKYVTWYLFFEPRIVRFAAMKLTSQPSQYWISVETL